MKEYNLIATEFPDILELRALKDWLDNTCNAAKDKLRKQQQPPQQPVSKQPIIQASPQQSFVYPAPNNNSQPVSQFWQPQQPIQPQPQQYPMYQAKKKKKKKKSKRKCSSSSSSCEWSSDSSSDCDYTYVSGYKRANGTKVKAYLRRK
eukprot:TRINITY_DN125_c0_g1_i14.p1 TRINITY_DN125_c0_g1~~TRINITY_DN125_c0_g1_i14.p1  ORF type:complete len:148 (+),score=22.28 TRINITY_DN125_c0_g1_i14:484-927(+)